MVVDVTNIDWIFVLMPVILANNMTSLRIIGKKGSKSRKAITDGTGIPLYRGNKKYRVDAIVNYGLSGIHMDSFLRLYPSAKKVPMINRYIGLSKLHIVNRAKRADVNVPESKLQLANSDDIEDFIEKRFKSIGGKGIRAARNKRKLPRGYYQRFIKDRVYELRIHTFLWMDNWVVQKRMGPNDQIAWNFSQGGSFITIHNPDSYNTFKEAKEISAEILEIVGMSFGAVDFIVDRDYKLWFLEINAAPGFTELSAPIYMEAFNTLKEMPIKKVLKYTS